MPRSDRLFELIQILRDGKLHRAEDLARRFDVSLRTIYRDMDTLAASGVPVEGARGAGYIVTSAITLPPLNLTTAELEALHLGIAVVGEGADPDLQEAARSLSAKIDAVLPQDRSQAANSWGFATYPFSDAARGFEHMPAIRAAIRVGQKLEISYAEPGEEIGQRVIRPLQMEYWGRVWTVTCWCEAAGDFRVFRVDRIESLKVLPALFVEEDGKGLEDYHARSG